MQPSVVSPCASGRVRRYKIVAGIDLSEYADIVLEHALDQAARHQCPELHLVTVQEGKTPTSEQLKQALWERAYPSLEAFNQHGVEWRAKLHVRSGKPEEQLAMLAAEIRADLIVIGHFGLHQANMPNRVMQAAICPTLVVGMPEAIDTAPQCPACVVMREDTDGDRWFCVDHADTEAHPMTPMTSWTHGSFQVVRAA